MNILQTCLDPKVFGCHFRNKDTWAAWFAFLSALFGLDLRPHSLDIYRRCTKREEPPTGPAREAWLVCGRRSGKSFILALTAVFLACFRDWRPYLGPASAGPS